MFTIGLLKSTEFCNFVGVCAFGIVALTGIPVLKEEIEDCDEFKSSKLLGGIGPPLSSLTLSAYLRVLMVCSQLAEEGETVAIMQVLAFPVKESFNT